MTRDEAIARCMSLGGWRLNECAAYVDDRFVNGVYCDGTIVVDVNGSRCIPAATVERVERARRADPVVVRPVSIGEAEDGAPSLVVPILALAGLGLVVYLATR